MCLEFRMSTQICGMSLCQQLSTLDLIGCVYSLASWIDEEGLRSGSSCQVYSFVCLGWGGITECRHVHLGQCTEAIITEVHTKTYTSYLRQNGLSQDGFAEPSPLRLIT